VVDELLQREGLDISQIKAILPSQFSEHLNQGLSDVLGIERDRVVDVLESGKDLFNNSVPYSLQRIRQQKLVKPGDLGLIINVGAGTQVGCATYRF
jgi:3-oxoacyl-[acyl-carrier-protein] synthase III